MKSNIRQKFLTGITVLLLGLFMLSTTQAFADNGYKGKGKQKEWQKTWEERKEGMMEKMKEKRFQKQGGTSPTDVSPEELKPKSE